MTDSGFSSIKKSEKSQWSNQANKIKIIKETIISAIIPIFSLINNNISKVTIIIKKWVENHINILDLDL